MTNAMAILILAMAMVESGNDPSKTNWREMAVGVHQIRQAAVDDVNRAWGTRYKLEDFRDPKLSAKAIVTYGRIYKARTLEDYARIWNGGPRGAKMKATEGYWEKVREEIAKARKARRKPPST